MFEVVHSACRHYWWYLKKKVGHGFDVRNWVCLTMELLPIICRMTSMFLMPFVWTDDCFWYCISFPSSFWVFPQGHDELEMRQAFLLFQTEVTSDVDRMDSVQIFNFFYFILSGYVCIRIC
ncbi:hypothetical protein PVK06_032370 [Gossypium arboreum]|uniref:Uncharacterized protein n=1 Tax=Gossypium arboreum TaxID=29729 RepID=A0ABR0NTK6_GOSAR|nr:hypothetical protein PVK06_032370 [Gossypium arboreum]